MKFKNTLSIIFCLGVHLLFAQESIEIEKKYTKAIERLAKNKKLNSAFATIEQLESKTMERHLKLTEIVWVGI